MDAVLLYLNAWYENPQGHFEAILKCYTAFASQLQAYHLVDNQLDAKLKMFLQQNAI